MASKKFEEKRSQKNQTKNKQKEKFLFCEDST